MVIPTSATKLPQDLDPFDVDWFGVDISRGVQGVTPFPILAPGENVAAFTVQPQPEAVDAGLIIMSGNGYPQAAIVGTTLSIYLAVAEAKQSNSKFDVGMLLGIELSITTDAVPPRKKQRTFTVLIINK
jgi:hypothetical protein